MRIAVTGASGNVGTALLVALGGKGEHELVGISRRQAPDQPPYSWAKWHCIDIAAPTAADHLTSAFAGADAVVHLAWMIAPTHDREALRRTNQGGTKAVVEAVRRADVPHLVHQSSIGAYAPGPGRTVDETWPVTGVPTSVYSVDKAATESIVSGAEPDTLVSRMRPALIFQDAAASEVTRYFLGRWVPHFLIRPGLVRFAPLPEQLAFQVVHADDVAAAIRLVLTTRTGGAFNVAAPPLINREVFRQTFGGVGPDVPPKVLRRIASATWHARLQPTEPGWIDLAAAVPELDTGRLEALGWTPTHDAAQVLFRFVAAMGRGAGRSGPLLYRRGA